ncbi:hypothetical protein B0H14DRAFT_2987907 [Mycena olivaceomarginata]|nr:hypothetical protein B0H14DRAFT_2987907 [Mycena olivaceomarginata]
MHYWSATPPLVTLLSSTAGVLKVPSRGAHGFFPKSSRALYAPSRHLDSGIFHRQSGHECLVSPSQAHTFLRLRPLRFHTADSAHYISWLLPLRCSKVYHTRPTTASSVTLGLRPLYLLISGHLSSPPSASPECPTASGFFTALRSSTAVRRHNPRPNRGRH